VEGFARHTSRMMVTRIKDELLVVAQLLDPVQQDTQESFEVRKLITWELTEDMFHRLVARLLNARQTLLTMRGEHDLHYPAIFQIVEANGELLLDQAINNTGECSS
jgi:hypothetical protein